MEGDWWRMRALTCRGHRRRGTESINGVTVSEEKRLMWLRCVPGESFCRSCRWRCPENTSMCIWEMNRGGGPFQWQRVSGSHAEMCSHQPRHNPPPTHPPPSPTPSLKFLFIYQSNHTCTHTLDVWATTHRLTHTCNAPERPQGRERGGRGVGGRGEWQRDPLCTRRWRVEQDKERREGRTKGARDEDVGWLRGSRGKSKDAGGAGPRGSKGAKM